MTALDYKGLLSTRVQLGIVAALGVTAGWIWGDVKAELWVDFLQWDLGAYMLSEVGAKGASAFKERKGA